MTFSSGAKYHGTFAAGKFNGQGTLYYPNGDVYCGNWVGGKKDGHGTYIYKASGARVDGTWMLNILQRGSFTDKYGNTYSNVRQIDMKFGSRNERYTGDASTSDGKADNTFTDNDMRS